MPLSSLVYLVLTRVLLHNLQEQKDVYLQTTCLASLANQAPHLKQLHPTPAAKFVSLLTLLGRKLHKLERARAAAPSPGSGASPTAGSAVRGQWRVRIASARAPGGTDTSVGSMALIFISLAVAFECAERAGDGRSPDPRRRLGRAGRCHPTAPRNHQHHLDAKPSGEGPLAPLSAVACAAQRAHNEARMCARNRGCTEQPSSAVRAHVRA